MKGMFVDSESTGVLGFEIYARSNQRCTPGEHEFAVIGHLHSPQEFLIGENMNDHTIWVVSADLSEVWPLNSSRTALEACLAAFARYIEDGPRDSAPLVLTAAEMQERLAKFQELLERRDRDEPVMRKPARPVISHRKRLKRLRQEFADTDPSSLSEHSWWAGVLEEAKHDLI